MVGGLNGSAIIGGAHSHAVAIIRKKAVASPRTPRRSTGAISGGIDRTGDLRFAVESPFLVSLASLVVNELSFLGLS
jgi:hypothetical protein